MQGHLIDEASKKTPSTQILINIISRRVRQLSNGHRPLVEVPHSTGFADIALMEVIQGKISYEATAEFKAEPVAQRDHEARGFGSRAA